MMARVLMLAPQPFFQHRGTPLATRRLLEILAAEGYRLDMLTYPEGDTVEIPGCVIRRTARLPLVHHVPAGFSWKKVLHDIVMLGHLLALRPNRQWDLIHASEESVFMALLVKWIFGVPYVYDMDSLLSDQLSDYSLALRPFRPLVQWLERQAVRSSAGVVVVCESLERFAMQSAPRVPVVRFEDVSLCDERAAEQADPLLRRIDGRLVMYVGNLESYQGIGLLLDAFVLVYHTIQDARLVVIGGSQERIRGYQRRADKLGVGDRVHFLGPRPVEQLGACLASADVLASPRIAGTNTPMKVYSYMASGTPIVATRLPTHLQVLSDETALLVPATPLDLAGGICRLLDEPALGRQLAARARHEVCSRYDDRVLAGKLAAFYETITASLERLDRNRSADGSGSAAGGQPGEIDTISAAPDPGVARHAPALDGSPLAQD